MITYINKSIGRSSQNLKVYTRVILPFLASCSARAIMNPRPSNTSSALDKSPSIDVKEYKYYLQYFTTTNITTTKNTIINITTTNITTTNITAISDLI